LILDKSTASVVLSKQVICSPGAGILDFMSHYFGLVTMQESDKNTDLSSGASTPPDMPRIVVVGGINMDLVVRTQAMPAPGQTVTGHSFSTIPGGRGANQAVAAARCDAEVNLIGRIGSDDFGNRLVLGLRACGVNTSPILVSEAVSTGASIIIVDENGDNAVCNTPGANVLLSTEDIDDLAEIISQADVVLIQLEIPQETAVYALQVAQRHNVPVILNPAPAPEDISPVFFEADIIVANQDETSRLSGEPAHDVHAAKMAGSALLARGARVVIVTLGRRGALALTPEQMHHTPPFSTKVVDITGVGDTFCGAFAAAYARDKDIYHATRFAAAAGALACGKFGAQPSMPRLCAIQKLLQRSC